MKTLYLVRHGKSDWDDIGANDMDRPMKSRGHKNSLEGAQLLNDMQVRLDLLLSSPAVRAFDTARIFADTLEVDDSKFEVLDSLYLPDFSNFLKTILYLDDKLGTVMIVGHEPSLSTMVHHFVESRLKKLVTGSITRFVFDTDSWKNIAASNVKEARHYSRHNWIGIPLY